MKTGVYSACILICLGTLFTALGEKKSNYPPCFSVNRTEMICHTEISLLLRSLEIFIGSQYMLNTCIMYVFLLWLYNLYLN